MLPKRSLAALERLSKNDMRGTSVVGPLPYAAIGGHLLPSAKGGKRDRIDAERWAAAHRRRAWSRGVGLARKPDGSGFRGHELRRRRGSARAIGRVDGRTRSGRI